MTAVERALGLAAGIGLGCGGSSLRQSAHTEQEWSEDARSTNTEALGMDSVLIPEEQLVFELSMYGFTVGQMVYAVGQSGVSVCETPPSCRLIGGDPGGDSPKRKNAW
jgi:hypothetical protein